jgi:23S rRNA pseudouridine1911/1915/1917 synthase
MAFRVFRGLERAPAHAQVGDVFCTVYTPDPDNNPIPVMASLPSLDAPPGVPVIYHLVVPLGLQNGARPNHSLIEILSIHTPLSESYIKDLCVFGALYARLGPIDAHVSPKPPRLTSLEQLLAPLASKMPIYIRMHATPRRHKALWSPTVLWDDGDVVVVNKPPGLPTIPSIDNAFECTLVEAENILREKGSLAGSKKLRVTSRLDVGTSGAVIFARSKHAVSEINLAFKENRVVKRYAVLSRNRPKCGPLRHLCRNDPGRGRGPLKESLVMPWNEANANLERWHVAELVVESVESVCGGVAWESTVRLITGRTHQIRLQFAASGWWVSGDTKYEGVGDSDSIASGEILGDSSNLHGLHAALLEFPRLDNVVVIAAGAPWWRTGDIRTIQTV